MKRELTNAPHRRYVTSPVTAKRNVSEGEWQPATIEGIASKVGITYDMYYFKERVEPGAFDDVLGDDVRALFNHDNNYVLGRTASKTLELYLNDEGHLAYRYRTPDRSFARDLEDMILTGDVSQCSFQFTLCDYHWEMEDGDDLLVITKMKTLLDVGPVTFPASQDTEVEAKRSLDMISKPKRRNVKSEQMQRRFKLLSLKQ